MKVSFVSLGSLAIFVTLGSLQAQDASVRTASISSGDSLLLQALEAEVDGDQGRRDEILCSAIEMFPDHPGVRWHSGHLNLDDQWVTVAQAEQAANAQGTVSNYRKLRSQFPESFQSDVMLARWCRKNGLNEQEKFHWISVLSRYDRNHAEARIRLGVKEYDGQLLTPEQAVVWQETKQTYREAWGKWHPKLKRWKREIERTRDPAETDAWRQLGELEDPFAIPALMDVFQDAEPEVAVKLVEVLGKIDAQMSTDALVRLAISSSDLKVRRLASMNLGRRSWFTFVPNLLGQLGNTVELEYSIGVYGLLVSSQLRYRQETDDSVQLLSNSFSSVLPGIRVEVPAPARGSINVRTALVRRRAEAARLAAQHTSRVQASLLEVQRWNYATKDWNSRVHETLCSATGLDLEEDAQSLRDWWKDYNDYERTQDKPVVYQSQAEVDYRPDIVLRTPRECFAAGTPVLTETGPVSIEEIRQGDRVLSQDPLTGELGYHFVAQVTTREEVGTLRLRAGGSDLVVTQGHPFWVIGQGWKMAKQLEVGDRLRCVQDEVMVEEKELGPEIEVFNLIVPESHSYFVGADRLLVHDATIRLSPPIPLPGWDTQKMELTRIQDQALPRNATGDTMQFD